jgi:hypothetical protein
MEENKVQTFNNAQFGRLRTLEIEGDSWFVGRDVAVALGYKDPAKAVREKVAVEDIAAKVLNTCAKSLRNSTFSREVPPWKASNSTSTKSLKRKPAFWVKHFLKPARNSTQTLKILPNIRLGKHSRRLNMNKALNVVGRILIFCVGEVSMYFAMMDPVIHIMLGDDINASRLLISWAALIITAIIDDKVLPVFNYDKGSAAHVK